MPATGATQNIESSPVTAPRRGDKVQNPAAGLEGTLEHTPCFQPPLLCQLQRTNPHLVGIGRNLQKKPGRCEGKTDSPIHKESLVITASFINPGKVEANVSQPWPAQAARHMGASDLPIHNEAVAG